MVRAGTGLCPRLGGSQPWASQLLIYDNREEYDQDCFVARASSKSTYFADHFKGVMKKSAFVTEGFRVRYSGLSMFFPGKQYGIRPGAIQHAKPGSGLVIKYLFRPYY
jgi:hypothetical protein